MLRTKLLRESSFLTTISHVRSQKNCNENTSSQNIFNKNTILGIFLGSITTIIYNHNQNSTNFDYFNDSTKYDQKYLDNILNSHDKAYMKKEKDKINRDIKEYNAKMEFLIDSKNNSCLKHV